MLYMYVCLRVVMFTCPILCRLYLSIVAYALLLIELYNFCVSYERRNELMLKFTFSMLNIEVIIRRLYFYTIGV